jgi:hypothetical protein
METIRVFVCENASANHVMNSLSPTENMNVANTSAKHVSPQRETAFLLYATIKEHVAFRR